jgi:hypothetical protein
MISQLQRRPVETMDSSQTSRDFEVVLHVGHPKTASTWLQETVFANPDSGFVIPWDNTGGRAVAAFQTVNSYVDDSAWARSFFEEGLARCAGGSGIPIISEENLCGNPGERIYNGRYVADRIHAAFPSAKILIGVREQKALAISLYREYLSLDGILRLDVFLGRGDELAGYTPILYPDYLEYDRIVGHFQKLYGRENVLVLPMESLQKDPRGYVESILKFCQCPGRIERPEPARRVGISAAALEVRRWFNPIMPISPLAPPQPTVARRAAFRLSQAIDRLAPKSFSAPLERSWKDIVTRRYTGMFRESNRRLADLTGIDFVALGYEL